MNPKEKRAEILDCAMTHAQIAEAMFLDVKTVSAIEKRALQKIRDIFYKRGILFKDLL
jgi:DNA-directed RNA polymerase specialized sigma24 family protein